MKIIEKWNEVDRRQAGAGMQVLYELEYYMEDEPFADLMDTFLRCMAHARRDGGLYCDGVVSKEA